MVVTPRYSEYPEPESTGVGRHATAVGLRRMQMALVTWLLCMYGSSSVGSIACAS